MVGLPTSLTNTPPPSDALVLGITSDYRGDHLSQALGCVGLGENRDRGAPRYWTSHWRRSVREVGGLGVLRSYLLSFAEPEQPVV